MSLAFILSGLLIATAPAWSTLASTAATALQEEHLNAEQYDRLLKREILTQHRETPKEKTGVRVAAFAVIRAPAETVFAAVEDCKRLPEFMPHFVACTDVEPDRPLPPNERWNENRLEFGVFRPKVKIRVVQHATLEPPYRLSWRRVSGDTKASEGYWRIIPLGENLVILAYDTLTDPGGAVPDWLQRILTKNDLPGTVEAVRRRVEEK
jgi:uncharacterized membrane protein